LQLCVVTKLPTHFASSGINLATNLLRIKRRSLAMAAVVIAGQLPTSPLRR